VTVPDSGGDFKPGLDFYDAGAKQGQALMLERFAASHDVKLVAISIGGNNFNFAPVIERCVYDYVTSFPGYPTYCSQDSTVTTNFNAANVARQTAAIETGLSNVFLAMKRAGYNASRYTIVVQNYPSPLPPGADIRYPEDYSRQTTGGCGIWNRDADWANRTVLPTVNGAVRQAIANANLPNVATLDLRAAYDARRLCDRTVGLLEDEGLGSWKDAGAVDRTEWINQIRTLTITGPYQIQEDFHPNYWAQLAQRSCLRQAYNDGAPRSGSCALARDGLNSRGEPQMAFTTLAKRRRARGVRR
jgi:hypothetical protein